MITVVFWQSPGDHAVMANQLKMDDVQAIVALHQHGWSDRRIALELGIDRETVGKYVKHVEGLRGAGQGEAKPASAPPGSAGGVPGIEGVDGSLQGPEGAPLGSVVQREPDSAGSKPASAPPGSTEHNSSEENNTSTAWPWRQVIEQKLLQGLSAQRIYQDLLEAEHGYAGSYYSVRRLVKKLSGEAPAPYRRMECAPGTEAQVDFGRGAPIVGHDGRRRATWVFRIVLSHSRKSYSEAVFRQTTDDFLRCLENAFAHFGGVTRTLVIDNLRAAVKRADWFDPELCPKVRSFAEHYGIAILPTKPYTPRHKGKVESSVKYVKNNGLKGRSFASLAEENRYLLEWESAVADTRIHGTTRQQVLKVFQEIEKPALLPLPTCRFDLFHEALRTVHRDGHVQVKGAYYSVPPEYLGQEIWARWDGRVVRLFDRKMRPIAVHAQLSAGRFATQSEHLHPHKINSIEKGADWMLGRIGGIGPESLAWAKAMLASRGIEGMRVLMGLLSLANTHSRQQIERACQVALGHGVYHLRSLRQLIAHQDQAPIQQHFEFASQHEIIRPVADYGQWLQDALRRQSSASSHSSEEDVA